MKKLPKATIPKPRLPKRLSFAHRHPFAVPIVTLSALVLFSLFGLLFFGGQTLEPDDAKVVSLHVDGKKQSVPTRATTVRQFLERAQINLSPEDVVEPAIDSQITSQIFSVNIYRARPVEIIDDQGKSTLTKTAETIPEVVAKRAGYNLYPEDNVTIAEPDQTIKDGVIGRQIVIDRAVLVKMNLFGTNYDVRTHAETVADLARERGVSIDNASVLPSPQTKLKPNDLVFITQPGKQIASTEEVVPFDQETVLDQNVPVGTTEVRTEGVPGKRAIVYEVSADGSKKILQEIVIAPAVKKVIVKGKKISSPNTSVAADKAALMSQAGIGSDQQSSADFIISRESGWRPAARNPRNCIGLGQKCNAASLISQCPNWETDAVCQLQHFNTYAVKRYGSWDKAYTFWQVNHWW